MVIWVRHVGDALKHQLLCLYPESSTIFTNQQVQLFFARHRDKLTTDAFHPLIRSACS